MVYPKPSVRYGYKYKLPDHLRRPRKGRLHDHTKIYDFLSDRDLFDIRGIGLARLDQEEIAQFEKEKKEKEAAAAAAAAAQKKVEPSATKVKVGKSPKKKRASLKPETKPEQSDEEGKVGSQNEVVASKSQVKVNAFSGGVKTTGGRGKKRKAMELIDSDEGITVSIRTAPSAIIKDYSDSSKENESGSDSQFMMDRVKERLSPQEILWNEALPRSCTVEIKSGYYTEKTLQARQQTSPPIRNETEKAKSKPPIKTESGKAKSNPPSLLKADATATTSASSSNNGVEPWRKAGNTTNPPKKKSAPKPNEPDDKPDAQKKPPTLLGPFKISENNPKNSNECKPGPSPPKKAKLKKPRNLTARKLSRTQILRKMRYKIEKHFARMPGIGYRCPSMRDRSQKTCETEDPERGKIWLCLVCEKEELDEKGDVMICCDRCDDWYHLRCIGVPDEKYPTNMKWYCKRCMARAIRTIREGGTFDPKDYPLHG